MKTLYVGCMPLRLKIEDADVSSHTKPFLLTTAIYSVRKGGIGFPCMNGGPMHHCLTLKISSMDTEATAIEKAQIALNN